MKCQETRGKFNLYAEFNQDGHYQYLLYIFNLVNIVLEQIIPLLPKVWRKLVYNSKVWCTHIVYKQKENWGIGWNTCNVKDIILLIHIILPLERLAINKKRKGSTLRNPIIYGTKLFYGLLLVYKFEENRVRARIIRKIYAMRNSLRKLSVKLCLPTRAESEIV